MTMKQTNRLRQTLLSCGLVVTPMMCLAGGGDGMVNSDPNQPPPQFTKVEFLYSTDDGKNFDVLKEGTQLRTQKDRYKVVFTPKEDYLVTILQKDSENNTRPWSVATRKLVKAGTTYTVPDEKYTIDCDGKIGKGFCLTGPPGDETLYFLAYPYEGDKAESTPGTYRIKDCSKPPCVKHVTFKHVD